MTEGQKVFEFAKEVGLETLQLMDKLKEWKISVRSHMATLDPEQIEEIKSRLHEEAETKKSTKKKSAAKKKTAKKKTKAKAKTVKKTAVKKAITKKTVTKKAASDDSDASRKVVRRKAGASKQAETATIKEKEIKAKSVVKKEEPENQIEERQNTQVAEDNIASTANEAAVSSKSETSPDTEPTAVKPGKKNIVGRIDMSKIAELEKKKSTQIAEKRKAAGSAPGPRGNIATPQVVPGPLDANKKEKSRKKLATKPQSETDSTRNTTEEVKSFNKTDFRKREVIFQPKKKKINLSRDAKKTLITKAAAHKRVVKVDQSMSVATLAQEMKVKPGQLITSLMKQGMMVRANDELDFDTISLIAPEFEYEAENVHKSVDELLEESAFGDLDADLQSRAPVVTVMGHVDHGKTSILDAIRKANVVSGEAGGITQHIGAYRVKVNDDQYATFLDTPGHEAFTAMRARGANVTDIAVIVIAADDGVMPQTAEAINHAKAADVPIIVAMNKMDRPNANPDKIKQQLTEFELVPEEWGGTTMFMPTSAINKEGIQELLEAIMLTAELLELKANPERSGKGIVVESRMEKGRGVVATLLVQDGTIRKTNYIVAGTSHGRIRAMIDDRGKPIDAAGPGYPAEILGLNEPPMAGDNFVLCENEKQAQEIVEKRRQQLLKEANYTPSPKMSLEDLFSKVQAGDVKELPVILKTDVAGSAEAIKSLFDKISTNKVKVKVIHNSVGGITESDVLLASTAGALVVGFNVRQDGSATTAAKKEGIQIKTYNIIYQLADEIRDAMRGILDPKIIEEQIGSAEVREIFKVPSVGTIAGCSVLDGKINRDAVVRLIRDNVVIYEGKLGSLKRFKDNVKEVAQGYECGLSIENFNDIKVGDIVEAYVKKEVQAELEDME